MGRLLAIAVTLTVGLCAQPVAVRQMEGEVRGFLVLRNEGGAIVANGDSLQTTRGGKVVYQAVYRFLDGSLEEETTIFTQSGHFRVLSDHLIQKGPTFPHPIDMTIDAVSRRVTVVHRDEKGEQKTESEHMDLPPDLANGIVPVLLKNLAAGTPSVTESMVVATPKPLLIKLQIHAEGEDSFTAGSARHKAERYNVHVDIGGLKGEVAKLLGKQPPDTLVWVLGGDCPSFVRARGPGFAEGPIWSTELTSPVFAESEEPATREKKKRPAETAGATMGPVHDTLQR